MFLGLLFVYLWVDQRNKLFGCMMLSAILMLFIFYLLLSIKKLSSSKHNVIVCRFEGYLIQFSYMSAVFWLNAMSYMAWTTFKQIRMYVNIELTQVPGLGLEPGFLDFWWVGFS